MIDTIHARLRAENLRFKGSASFKKRYGKFLPGRTLPTGRLDTFNPIIKDYGDIVNIRNMRFFVRYSDEERTKVNLISFKGSLAKFLQGDNAQRDTELQAKDALMLLMRVTGLPILEFEITRLDFSINIPTEKVPKTYYKFLDSIPRYAKYDYEDRPNWSYIRFETSSGYRQLVVYDKTKHLREEAEEFARLRKQAKKYGNDIFIPKHLIRVEMRVLKRMKEVFGFKKIGDTIKKENYKKLYEELETLFLKRLKRVKLLKFEDVQDYQDLHNYYLYAGVIAKGGMSRFEEVIKSYEGKIDEAYLKRLKDQVKGTMKRKKILYDPPEVEELDFKFEYEIKRGKKGKLNFGQYPEFWFDKEKNQWKGKEPFSRKRRSIN